MATQTVDASAVARQAMLYGEAKRLQGVFNAGNYSAALHSRACALVTTKWLRMLNVLYPFDPSYSRLP